MSSRSPSGLRPPSNIWNDKLSGQTIMVGVAVTITSIRTSFPLPSAPSAYTQNSSTWLPTERPVATTLALTVDPRVGEVVPLVAERDSQLASSSSILQLIAVPLVSILNCSGGGGGSLRAAAKVRSGGVTVRTAGRSDAMSRLPA